MERASVDGPFLPSKGGVSGRSPGVLFKIGVGIVCCVLIHDNSEEGRLMVPMWEGTVSGAMSSNRHSKWDPGQE